MAIPYAVVKQKIMFGENEGQELYYARAVSSGDSDIEKLSELVGARASISAADAKSLMDSLNWVMPIELKEGKTIRLGELGSFFITIRSEGTEDPKKMNATRIKKPKIHFRPGKALRQMLNNLTYEPEKVKEVKVEVPCGQEHV